MLRLTARGQGPLLLDGAFAEQLFAELGLADRLSEVRGILLLEHLALHAERLRSWPDRLAALVQTKEQAKNQAPEIAGAGMSAALGITGAGMTEALRSTGAHPPASTVHQPEAQPKSLAAAPSDGDDVDVAPEAPPLQARVWPVVRLIEGALQAQVPVLWERLER